MKTKLQIFASACFMASSFVSAQSNQLPNLATGMTRVYFFPGHQVGVGWKPKLDSSQLGPVYVGNLSVGTLAEESYFVVDLKAGPYEIGCAPLDAPKNFPVAKKVTFKAGTYKYFACDVDSFAEDTRAKDAAIGALFAVPLGVVGGALGGAIGGAAAGLSGDFKTKTYLEEQPLPASYKFAGYINSNDLPIATEVVDRPNTAKSDSNSSKPQDTAISRLEDLKQMRQQGLITEAEYRAKKKTILDQM